MAIVTMVEGVSRMPDKQEVELRAEACLPKLFEMWMTHHEAFIAGKRFAILAYPRGTYAPMKDGPTLDGSAFMKAPVAIAFSITDDPAAEQSPYCLRVMQPDPDFMPTGVVSGHDSEEEVTLRYVEPDE